VRRQVDRDSATGERREDVLRIGTRIGHGRWERATGRSDGQERRLGPKGPGAYSKRTTRGA
jgi:hypothetical protein